MPISRRQVLGYTATSASLAAFGNSFAALAARIAAPSQAATAWRLPPKRPFRDDAHDVGGALTLDNYDWGAEFKTVLVGPPDPAIVGDRWRDMSGGSDWTMSITEGNPNSSVWKLEWFSHLERPGWNTTVRSTLELTSMAEEFRIRESIHALEGETPVFERHWDNRIKRDLM